MILQAIVVALAAVVAILTWRRLRPLSLLLLRVASFDLIRETIGLLWLRPERARLLILAHGDEMRRAPFSGVVRLLFHLDQALYLAGPATVAAFSVWAFSRRSAGRLVTILLTWLGCSCLIAGLYPRLSGLAWAEWSLALIYQCAHVAASLVTLASMLALLRHRTRPELRHRAALKLGGAELLVAFAGPYAWGEAQGAWTRWGLAQIIWAWTFAWIGWDCLRERHARNSANTN